MSRREKTPASIMSKVDNISEIIKEVSDDLVNKYCKDLDNEMLDIRKRMTQHISDSDINSSEST